MEGSLWKLRTACKHMIAVWSAIAHGACAQPPPPFYLERQPPCQEGCWGCAVVLRCCKVTRRRLLQIPQASSGGRCLDRPPISTGTSTGAGTNTTTQGKGQGQQNSEPSSARHLICTRKHTATIRRLAPCSCWAIVTQFFTDKRCSSAIHAGKQASCDSNWRGTECLAKSD
jgi:hypothetical protein